MSIGLILLIVTGLLVVFGVGERALDRLRLTDRQALLCIALIIGLGFVPDIPLGKNVTVNLGGCVLPVLLCAYLFIKAGTWMERGRAIAATLVTATAVYIIGRYTANEPETITFDPNYLYGIAAGVIPYLFGRSRRSAFIAGVLGVLWRMSSLRSEYGFGALTKRSLWAAQAHTTRWLFPAFWP